MSNLHTDVNGDDFLSTYVSPPPPIVSIITVCLETFPSAIVEVRVGMGEEGFGNRITAAIYRLTDDRIIGYMPSRAFYHENKLFLLYYVNPDMPVASRPFGGDYCYAFVHRFDPSEGELIYNADTRVFIDQVINNDGQMNFLFMFGESQCARIMRTRFDGTQWVGPD